ncbi:hypothetical protein LENED_006485 [Lentinula edodes]|uniref:Uncharacterized protein n=1 Tax=Lentinula edodes TaxID=5353 RepID=A0A1Q3EC11_LENED|nr:hypothetical protein LENED_006485 [Lentinula edodes]
MAASSTLSLEESTELFSNFDTEHSTRLISIMLSNKTPYPPSYNDFCDVSLIKITEDSFAANGPFKRYQRFTSV